MFQLKIILLAIVTFMASLQFQVMSADALALSQPLTVETMGISKLFSVTLIS
ncbi:hypothetical protein [Crocosphaera chwakensis]|uniref:Uncharacterized protein n=1 Tax=Crocosphaera chwakensis CCY0110 TaxID=391612 RepID=A3ITJ5_9CHRO|nr:hypothetical protein [Crocosphaera chwakensis]EAZ90176.1 hypothetical protein CY0110_30538 [Crocosphaera chwakensis CCY0110]